MADDKIVEFKARQQPSPQGVEQVISYLRENMSDQLGALTICWTDFDSPHDPKFVFKVAPECSANGLFVAMSIALDEIKDLIVSDACFEEV